MSTFDGIINEIPGISVDNFTGDNLKSNAFFLSHFHWDHYKGLFKENFIKRIEEDNVFFYASAITIKIISHRMETDLPSLKPKFKELKVFIPMTIDLPTTNENLIVTAMPAGHCMGSVMFLFETDSKKILYTGDFRIDPEAFGKLPPLLNENKFKRIDNIYLDTTFFFKKYATFPKRSDLIQRLLDTIKSWLDDDPSHRICIYAPANYTYEFVFQEIWKNLNEKVYVSATHQSIYPYLYEMDNVYTKYANESRIEYRVSRYPDNKTPGTRNIKLSACRFNDPTEFFTRDNDYSFFMCYASHASYNEIKTILEMLKPIKITPCVVPDKFEEQHLRDELYQLIGDTLNSFKKEDPSPIENTDCTFKLDQLYDYKITSCNSFVEDLPESPPSTNGMF